VDGVITVQQPLALHLLARKRLHPPVALHVLGVAFERLIPQPLDSVGRVPDRESPAIRPECEQHSEARH
jgi:hypothetical protein